MITLEEGIEVAKKHAQKNLEPYSCIIYPSYFRFAFPDGESCTHIVNKKDGKYVEQLIANDSLEYKRETPTNIVSL